MVLVGGRSPVAAELLAEGLLLGLVRKDLVARAHKLHQLGKLGLDGLRSEKVLELKGGKEKKEKRRRQGTSNE